MALKPTKKLPLTKILVGSPISKYGIIDPAHQWPSGGGGELILNLGRKYSAVSSANNTNCTPEDGRGISFVYEEYRRGERMEP
ncbi:hypothetical protein EVAR_74503_1 [Eumeta japonica]|uniref:Uncharacterized protein n=1 Tax=Eumeta variegata TaxID=151549 RepID=A0A4C1TCN0_EUMVA|nr:hypothetical protein EVAR_74503_1 [Eumeta japonica]